MNSEGDFKKDGTGAFHEKHSLAIRIWHWTTFITITSSLVLVLLGSTMFRTGDNISLVREQLERKGAVVTQDPIKDVHSIVQYLLYTYILVHLIGVVRADIGKYRGIVSGMIHGKK